MTHLDLGGCCLAKLHSGAIAMLPSKADRIMSRYRPIAPKPAALCSSGSIVTDPSSSTCASVITFSSRQVPDPAGKGKRARKRRGEPPPSPKLAKKAKSDKARPGLSNTAGGMSSLTQGTPDGAVPSGEASLGGLISCAPNGFSVCDELTDFTRAVPCESSEASNARRSSCGVGACFVANPSSARSSEGGGMMQRSSPTVMGSTGMLEKDAAFMERAAASAPSTVLPGRMSPGSISCKSGDFVGGFTEMIRGITRLPTAADVHSLMHSRMKTGSLQMTGKAPARRSVFPLVPSPARASGCGLGEYNAVAAAEEDEDEVDCLNTELVTLPLLPETPSRSDYSPAESCLSTCTSLASLSVRSNKGCERQPAVGTAGVWPSRLSLFGDELGAAPTSTGSCSTSKCFSGSSVDQAYLEQVYGGSSEPVLLVDDSQQVLWFNKAFQRASKSAFERQASKTVSSGPYIDPLGHPTPLGCFTLQAFGQPTKSSATLWGFLKKFVFQDPEVVKEGPAADGSSVAGLLFKESSNQLSELQYSNNQLSELCLGLRERDPAFFSTEKDSWHRRLDDGGEETTRNGVITPQPTRLVGSTVSLESVTEILLDATPTTESLEAIEARLESSLPAFITDSSNRVRWVNTAYKQMVGQPECPWLASTTVTTGSAAAVDGSSSSPSTPRLTGEVLLVCPGDKVPHSASSFSGRVNVQWTKTGERSSMTVPCDVCRVCTECGSNMLVWKFDIAASLRLTCGI